MRRRPTLRQTARAAALLAWLAGNVVLWWLLPPVPRLTLPVSFAEAKVHSFSSDGRWLATSGYGDTADPVRLWDVETGAVRVIHPIDPNAPKPPAPLQGVRFSADGRRLVWDDAHDTVHLFDLASERELAAFRWPDEGMQRWPEQTALATPDSTTVLAANVELVLWDVPSGRVRLHVRKAATDSPDYLLAYDLSPDGKLLATATGGGVQLWDVATGRQLWAVPAGSWPAVRVQFAPDGRCLTVGDAGRWMPPKSLGFDLRVRDVSTGQVLWQQASVPSFTWTGDGRLAGLLAPSVHDARIVFWDETTGDERATAPVLGTQTLYSADATAGSLLLVPGYHVSFSVAGWPLWAVRLVDRLLMHGSRPAFECRLLDAATGRVAATYSDIKEYRWAQIGRTAMLAPDGRTVVTVDPDNAIRLWDVPPRKPWGWFAAAIVGQLAVAALLRSVAKRRRA